MAAKKLEDRVAALEEELAALVTTVAALQLGRARRGRGSKAKLTQAQWLAQRQAAAATAREARWPDRKKPATKKKKV